MRTLRRRRNAPAKTYAAAVDRAYRRVPFYREQWAEAGTSTPRPVPVPASALAARHRFIPLGGADDHDPPSHAGELFDALMLTERYTPEDDLFDVQKGLRDLTSIGARNSGRYRVVLTHDADVDPNAEVDLRKVTFEEYSSTAHAVLLADAAQLKGLGIEPAESQQEGGSRRILRRGDLTELSEVDVLYDSELGYLGGRPGSCGHVHVDPTRVDVRELAGVLVFSRIDRDNPTLLHIAPSGGTGTVLGRCEHHEAPVLAVKD